MSSRMVKVGWVRWRWWWRRQLRQRHEQQAGEGGVVSVDTAMVKTAEAAT